MPLHFPLSIRGTLHVIFGTGQMVLLPFAALLINFSLARREGWRSARRVLLWTAGLPLLGFLSFAVYSAIFVFPLGPDAYGPGVNIGWPPRFTFLTYMLWVVSLGWQATRCSCGASKEIQDKRAKSLWAKPIAQTWMSTFPRNPRPHSSYYSLCEARSAKPFQEPKR